MNDRSMGGYGGGMGDGGFSGMARNGSGMSGGGMGAGGMRSDAGYGKCQIIVLRFFVRD